MKVKIKSTGDIMPIAPYAKVTLNVCDDRGTPYEVDFEDVELLHEDATALCVDWDAFRREATKDLLFALVQGNESYDSIYEVHHAVEMADELIKTLRDGKESKSH